MLLAKILKVSIDAKIYVESLMNHQAVLSLSLGNFASSLPDSVEHACYLTVLSMCSIGQHDFMHKDTAALRFKYQVMLKLHITFPSLC